MHAEFTWLKPITKLVALGVMFFCCSLYAQVVVSDSCDSAVSQAKLAGWNDNRISEKMRFEAANSKAADLGKLKDGYDVMSREKFRDPLGGAAVDTGFYLCATKNELTARANGSSGTPKTASSSASQPPQAATHPNVANNQSPQPSSGNITAECDQEQSRIISKATADAKALVATGDLAGMQRIQLVRNIAMRDLYSGGRCSGANNATVRREQAQKFINMDQRFCQQWGMGSQCAAPPVLAANKSSSTASSNSQDESSSNATGKQSIERADRCIDIRNTHVQGNDAQWYRVTNTCSSAIKFYSANNSERYGNLKNLAPGQTDTSWWSLRTKSSLPWVACPEKSTNGKDVRLDESNANSLACFYYN